MAEKRKKRIPKLDPSITNFDKYYKGNDGQWYVAGTISFEDPPCDPQVPEAVVAEAVDRHNQSRRREAVSKLRKLGKIEAKVFAEQVVQQAQPKPPFAVDIKVVGQDAELGELQTVYRGLVTGYGYSSLEPEKDPYAKVYPEIVSRGKSKAYTCKFNTVVLLKSIPK